MAAGTRKGIPNKNKQALIKLLQTRYPDYHPVIAMAEIAHDMENDIAMRFNAHKEVAQYVVPKLKATEITGEGGGPMQVTIIDKDARV